MVRCTLCPKECELAHSERGDCRARVNLDGKLITLVYGKPCSANIDPVEKKPMFHFLPGTRIFSIATAGCNLHCKNCQNWEISQREPETTRNIDLPPEAVVRSAANNGCRSIAYTYSEPMTFFEYALDTGMLARKWGLKNVLVTAAYINEKPMRELCKMADGANVDLKGYSDKFYREVCDGDLQTVLRSLEVMREEGVFVEVTNLIIPTYNDGPDMIRKLCDWLVKNMGPETPLHFSRFFPYYRMRNLYRTPVETLKQARDIALDVGMYYVYMGNVPDEYEDTYCPECDKLLISRTGYRVNRNVLEDGKCPDCGKTIAGVWK